MSGSGSGFCSFADQTGCIAVVGAGGPVVAIILCFLLVVLPVCLCVRKRRRRRREIEDAAKPASSDYKIQSAHTE